MLVRPSTPTLHFALVFGSIATYEAAEGMRFEREGAVGNWHYRASVGQIPEGVRTIMAVRPVALEALLRRLTGQPDATASPQQDRLAARDEAIDRAAQNYRFEAPWSESGHLFTCIEVSFSVDVDPDPARASQRYFWFDALQAEAAALKNKEAGEQAAQAILAALLPQLHYSMFAHSWHETIQWISAVGKPACPVPIFRAGSATVWTSPSEAPVVEQVRSLTLPSQMSAASSGKLAILGRWRVAATVETDAFRQFLWCLAGLQVVSEWIAPMVKTDLLTSLDPETGRGAAIKELFCPTNDEGREPQRNLVANFAAMALALSPNTAVADVAALKNLWKYRNKIHGGSLNPDAAPAGRAADLWQRYSALAAKRLMAA